MGAIINCLKAVNEGVEDMCRNCALCLGKKFKIEELTKSAIFAEDEVITNLQGAAIIALMKESRQMLNVIRAAGFYMLALTLIYFVQTVYQLKNLKESDFIG